MLEIKRRDKMKVTIYGEAFELSRPTFGQVEAMQVAVKERGDAKAGEVTIEFLEVLGLPRATTMDMDLQDIQTVVEAVCGSKKN